MTGILTGSFSWDGGSVVLLEIEDGRHVAVEPRTADALLSAPEEEVEIEFEPWQIVGIRKGRRKES